MATFKKSPPADGGFSSDSSKKPETPGAKRRPSRAGTRSVSTLSAAQLERKRANDREAQRAIRQRTKDHIADLERQIQELTAQRDTAISPKMDELMRRNQELEQENALLRSRLSHAVAALGVPEQGPATGGAPSPSDRIHMLSQPRPSTSTPRSMHAVPDMATPVSQPAHWAPSHTYPANVSSPHIHGTPTMVEVPVASDAVPWPQPRSQSSHQPGTMPMPDQPLQALDSTAMSYPNPYGMDNNARSLSYPFENPQLVTSQPMQAAGYSTPTSARSPHPSDFQRHHMSLSAYPPGPHPAAQQPQQQGAQTPYSAFPPQAHQSFVPQASHPGDMQPLMAPHPQAPPMAEPSHMMYQQYPPNIKVDQPHYPPNMKLDHH
ncbi:uncharacterized protein EI97DRAFT_374526 [Westerdykella ornata]|uniref:BZIP domain-containing protein n=1 Tax=Westerdykella ornata TaxID=318751 RepID=A0A6A6JPR1_WESOR|nr:uncharacterized protein EI97DRAFT_374526 [Westerdykella ornata]KAF2277898.1 hypothetical protein EI97DRAFT_374526 [Westerdykella ornata]